MDDVARKALEDRVPCSMTLCCVSTKNVKRNHNLEKSGRIVELLIASRLQNIVTSTTSLGSQSCSSGGFTQDTPRFSSSPKCRRCSRTSIRISSKGASSSCRCTTTLIVDQKRNEEVCKQNSTSAASDATFFQKGRCTVLEPGDGT